MNTRNGAIDFSCNFEATHRLGEQRAVMPNTNKICLTKKPIHLNRKRHGDKKNKSFASGRIDFTLSYPVSH